MSATSANADVPVEATLAPPVRCLTRRVCDWAKANRDRLSQFTWLWRGGILFLLLAGGFYAWLVWEKVGLAVFLSATLTIVVLLGFFVTWAILDLPRIVFYVLFWLVVSLTSLADLLFFLPYLFRRPNKVALGVLLVNGSLLGLALFAWAKYAA